jgi:hypothetical protein
MARFHCSACGQEGLLDYDPRRHACPLCGSRDATLFIPLDELPDQVLAAIAEAEPLDPDPDET